MKSSVAYYFSFDNGINVYSFFYSIKYAEEHGKPIYIVPSKQEQNVMEIFRKSVKAVFCA